MIRWFNPNGISGKRLLLPMAFILAASAAAPIAFAGPVTRLALTGATTAPSGTCSAAIIVESQNAKQVNTPVVADTTVNVWGSSNGTFYSDANCMTPGHMPVIAAGTSHQSFYLKDNTPQSLTIEAASTGLKQAQLAFQVSGAATQLEHPGSQHRDCRTLYRRTGCGRGCRWKS